TGIYVGGWMSYTATETGSKWGEQYTACLVDDINLSSDLDNDEKIEQVENIEKWGKALENPILRILITSTEILPIGLIVSLLTGLILRRK
ncbi:MAG: DUF4199 domain-containing protein, partial [Bacteroidetes bacterium]|nr:DUF4199 domain-containing protein [Bacteroidota bacterium]